MILDAVVVGGGISGLAAAREMAAAGLRVLLLDASPRLGGKIAGAALGDLRLDVGAESALVRRPEVPALVASLDVADRLVHPTRAGPSVYVGGHAVELPSSVLGVPSDLDALAGLLSSAGLERARQEPTLPAPPLTADLAIGALTDERFGPEVTDRLLEPLLGGVYAGHARRLSFEAVNAALFERARAGGPLSEHARGIARSGDGPVFGSLVGGLVALVEGLVADLSAAEVEIRCGATVRELATAAGGFRLTVGPTRDAYSVDTRTVVLATPAAPTGRLLAGHLPSAESLAAIPYASMAVVAVAVRGLDPVGSGLLMPPGELPTIKAVTHSSVKWAWLGDAARRIWGESGHVIRASVGRLGDERLLQIDDDALAARTVAELGGLPGWADAEVLTSVVQRWGGGLPQYEVGHRGLVARLRDELTDRPGLAVCGAAYDGVGIAACLGSAHDAVSKITADLGTEMIKEAVGRQV